MPPVNGISAWNRSLPLKASIHTKAWRSMLTNSKGPGAAKSEKDRPVVMLPDESIVTYVVAPSADWTTTVPATMETLSDGKGNEAEPR